MQLPERLVALALAFALDLKNLLGAGGWGGVKGTRHQKPFVTLQQDLPDAGERASCPESWRTRPVAGGEVVGQVGTSRLGQDPGQDPVLQWCPQGASLSVCLIVPSGSQMRL